MKAQQQIDQGGLARTRAADEANALSGADGEAEPVKHRAATILVRKAHLLKAHFALRHPQGLGAGGVHHLAGARQGVDTVLDGAHAFKQGGYFPHHPVGVACHAQGHGGNGSHRARAHLALRPQPQRGAAGAQNHAHHQHMVDDFKPAHQSHLRVAGELEGVHGGAGKLGFAVGVREQLDGGDVGVRVGDAPGHEGAGVGLVAADLAQAGHKVPAHQAVAHQPARKRQQQPRIKAPGQQQDGDEVHAHAHHHVGGGEDHVAHGQRGLHDLGGDAAGELVGIKGHALAQHQAVKVPAQAQRQVDGQRLVLDAGAQRHQRNAAHHGCGHPGERVAALSPQGGGRGGGNPVHHAAQHGEQQGFVHGNQRRQPGHRHHIAAHAARAGPHERQKPPRRQRRLVARVTGNAFFEKLEQQGRPPEPSILGNVHEHCLHCGIPGPPRSLHF